MDKLAVTSVEGCERVSIPLSFGAIRGVQRSLLHRVSALTMIKGGLRACVEHTAAEEARQLLRVYDDLYAALWQLLPEDSNELNYS